MHEKLERFRLAVGQPQAAGRMLGDPQPDLAMVFGKALAQIVDQQRQMEHPFLR